MVKIFSLWSILCCSYAPVFSGWFTIDNESDVTRVANNARYFCQFNEKFLQNPKMLEENKPTFSPTPRIVTACN